MSTPEPRSCVTEIDCQSTGNGVLHSLHTRMPDPEPLPELEADMSTPEIDDLDAYVEWSGNQPEASEAVPVPAFATVAEPEPEPEAEI